MANRLNLISGQLASSKLNFVDSSVDYLNFASLLTLAENEKEIHPKIHSYVDEAKFPEYLIPKLRQLNILDYFLKAPYGKQYSNVACGSIVAQIYRGDPGVGTFLIVQWIVAFTIQTLGSQEQKVQYLPKIKNLEIIGGWGLTEQKIGSDASNLSTTVTKTLEGYKINGNKRWIGNGNRDIVIVWAKNTENKKVQACIVQNQRAGVSHTVIKNKLALRIVQNCHILYNNIVVPQENKLPKATDFAKGTNVVLKHSRIYICWGAIGLMLGVYDHVIKYATTRKQFGQPIAGFQLIQEKIVKIMATTQASLFLVYRISQLADQNNIGICQITLTKAWVTDKRWGREIFGGNGIIHENYVMKAAADAEALYTYEGTYDINTLVAGRQLTGISAFKK